MFEERNTGLSPKNINTVSENNISAPKMQNNFYSKILLKKNNFPCKVIVINYLCFIFGYFFLLLSSFPLFL